MTSDVEQLLWLSTASEQELVALVHSLRKKGQIAGKWSTEDVVSNLAESFREAATQALKMSGIVEDGAKV